MRKKTCQIYLQELPLHSRRQSFCTDGDLWIIATVVITTELLVSKYLLHFHLHALWLSYYILVLYPYLEPYISLRNIQKPSTVYHCDAKFLQRSPTRSTLMFTRAVLALPCFISFCCGRRRKTLVNKTKGFKGDRPLNISKLPWLVNDKMFVSRGWAIKFRHRVCIVKFPKEKSINQTIFYHCLMWKSRNSLPIAKWYTQEIWRTNPKTHLKKLKT